MMRRNKGSLSMRTILSPVAPSSILVANSWRLGSHLRSCALLLTALFVSSLLLSCGGGSSNPSNPPPQPPSNSGYFPYQQGWLGADGAYSVPLGGDQSLWIFADTFIGPATATSRTQSTGFIHNSIAISSCSRQSCTFQYYWSGMNTSAPGPVFSAPNSDWFWPMDGFIYNGTFYLALMQMHATGSGAFGFAYSGAQLASISNYTAPPSQWSIAYQNLNAGGSAMPGAAIVVGEGPNGNPDPSNPQGASYAYFFTVVPTGSSSPPYMALLRLPLSQLNFAARPGNSSWEYLKSDSTWGAWPDTDNALPSDHAMVIDPGATEMTVRYHASTNQWIAVYPIGLDNKAHYSLSSSLTGSWGPSEDLYSYPEMQPTNPNYTPDVFCYAAKEHVELETAGQIFFTYACNSTQATEVSNNMNLYHPVVVVQPLPST
jgi:hypothetical protein